MWNNIGFCIPCRPFVTKPCARGTLCESGTCVSRPRVSHRLGERDRPSVWWRMEINDGRSVSETSQVHQQNPSSHRPTTVPPTSSTNDGSSTPANVMRMNNTSLKPKGPRITRADSTVSQERNTLPSRVTIDELLQTMQDEADPLWQLMRREAEEAAAGEPQLASSLYSTILVHDSLEETLAFVLANALDNPSFQATQWIELFREALQADSEYGSAVRADISAFVERDPAMSNIACVLLYAKGFHALEAWRLAHWLWVNGRESLALYLQSMISSRFAVDIHPSAKIGSGVLIDHGTGIVIGGTAVLGNNVSMLQNVTLGGTGKHGGDRHPKVADGVMIGAGATVLGNIAIGEGAHIAACSVVLKPVEPYAIVSGVPAKVVGKVSYTKEEGRFPSFVMDQRLSIEVLGASNPYQNTVTGSVKGAPDTMINDIEGQNI